MNLPDDARDRDSALLIVPRAPGPLVDPGPPAPTGRVDEIDEVVEDFFGPDPNAPPGWVDVVLVVGGAALVLWALRYSTWLAVVGAIAVVLGLVLPIRSAWRWIRRNGAARRRASLLSRGLPLDVSHPLTRALADAYEALLEQAARPPVAIAPEAVSAGHLAVVEVASLLDGSVPSGGAEAAYVEARTRALEALVRALDESAPADAEASEVEPPDEWLERAARAMAGEELDALGLSSLSQLDELTKLVEPHARVRGG